MKKKMVSKEVPEHNNNTFKCCNEGFCNRLKSFLLFLRF